MILEQFWTKCRVIKAMSFGVFFNAELNLASAF
jgi:hypothetical protein